MAITRKTKLKKGKRPEFTAKAPKGLTPAQLEAWERAALESGGNTWQPQEQGDTLAGRLVSSGMEKGKYGEQRVLQIESEGTVRKVYCSTILESEFQRVQPKNGAELVIIFKGSYPTGRGRPAKLFGMAVVDRKKTKK